MLGDDKGVGKHVEDAKKKATWSTPRDAKKEKMVFFF
jgi:hypothetical protein